MLGLDQLFAQAERDHGGLFGEEADPKSRAKPFKLAVLDFETDPFRYLHVPEPFCCEFHSEDITEVFWDDDPQALVEQLIRFLGTLDDPYRIYAHNGGKFDFHFLLRHVENPALIIQTRIVKCKLLQHELRDSYAILPVPLKDYEKMEFDYSKMERDRRHKYRSEILEYLHSDCVHLYTLVKAFNERFGPRMTIGGTAIRELRKLHPFRLQGAKHDAMFRQYYYGGRVQVFKAGKIDGPVKLVDINSAYPAAMRNFNHPINGRFHHSKTIPDTFDDPYFVTFTGTNHNALPSLGDDGGLCFTRRSGVFKACSHELKIALEHELVTIDEVHECLVSTDHISFGDYVDKFYAEKTDAKQRGDKTTELFAKLLLNSAYGRMGINPDNFAEWTIFRDFGSEQDLKEDGYVQACDYEHMELWSKPVVVDDKHFCDVGIAASITSAARSILLEGLQNAADPYYCDTDSIICRGFNGDVDKYRLGAWDLEKVADKAAIAGKKMYALYNDAALELVKKSKKTHTSFTCSKCKLAFTNHVAHSEHQLACEVKLSSKGGSLDLAEIVRIADGESVHYENKAPTFSLKKPPAFIQRTFKKTVDYEADLEYKN